MARFNVGGWYGNNHIEITAEYAGRTFACAVLHNRETKQETIDLAGEIAQKMNEMGRCDTRRIREIFGLGIATFNHKGYTAGLGFKFKETTEERYWEMLCVLPPEYRGNHGFLVGEEYDHTPGGIPRFKAFWSIGGKFYECEQPLTVERFKGIDTSAMVAMVEDETQGASK